MRWVVIGVETHLSWPEEEKVVNYRGHEILMRPESTGEEPTKPDVVLELLPPMTPQEGLALLRQFLSSLAFLNKCKVLDKETSRAGYPIKIGNRPLPRLIRGGRTEHLPEPVDDDANLALALYREAQSSESPAYRFLNFYKVLNIKNQHVPDQVNWIDKNLSNVTGNAARNRIREIQKSGSDVGKYLAVSGRCAIAHAFSQPLVNPDKSEDKVRLERDVPLIQSLAEVMMKQEFGI